MKPPYYLILSILIYLLMGCQIDAEQEPISTPASVSAVTADQSAVPTTAADNPVLTQETPSPLPVPPTLTNTPTREILPAEDQVQQTATSTAEPSPTAEPLTRPAESLILRLFLDGFSQPLYLTHAGDDRLFVVEKVGTIQVVQGGIINPQPFLDLRDRISSTAYEQGLLSVAFHQQYAQNGYFYVNYTDLFGATVIARYQRDKSDPNLGDRDSEQILLRILQPYVNHNGGQLQFGPDGFLYIGMGDGGSGGDPERRGQDGSVLLGKLLRIDVNGKDPYSLPETNPFLGMSSRRNEIWAQGLRNPWRFSFDRQTGDLWLADVGQSLWEEVNFQPARSQGGENYGWNIMEGGHCYNQTDCESTDLTLPVGEYSHEDGNCSISGGYVYRGQAVPDMNGNYIFGDYCSGFIWRLFRHSDGSWSQAQIADSNLYISSFGEDVAGELYVLDHIGGAIYSIELQ